MNLLIRKPEDLRLAKVLVFGPPGHGKTTFLGTAQYDERTSPILILDFEGGSESLVGLDVDIVRVTSWDIYTEAFDYLANDKHDYKSVGIDSISETHIFSLLNILRLEGPTRKDPDLLQQGDYGKALVLMRRFLRDFRDLPMHVFFTSLAKEDLDSREGMVKKPALAGALADEAPGMMGIVGYLALTTDVEGNTMRTLLLKDYPRIRTKVRSSWAKHEEVPNEIDNPTVTALLDALQYRTSEGDPA
jgi:hypothetical protein